MLVVCSISDWLPHSICGFYKNLLLLFPFPSLFHFLRFQSPAFCIVTSLDFKKPSWDVGGDSWPVGADTAQVRLSQVTPGLMTLTRGWLLSGSLSGSQFLCTEGRGETCLSQVLSSAGAEAQLCPRVCGPTPHSIGRHRLSLLSPAACGEGCGSFLPSRPGTGSRKGKKWWHVGWFLPGCCLWSGVVQGHAGRGPGDIS